MILLIRHGQSTANERRELVGRGDPDLTSSGERQARALAPYRANVVALWTSPLRRARATAALAFADLEPVVKESFIEVDYGSLEGTPLDGPHSPLLSRAVRDHEATLGGGESLASVDRRVWRELDTLSDDPSSLLYSNDSHLAIVTHVSPIKSAVAWALGVDGSVAWRMRLDNGSVTCVGARGAVVQLVSYNVLPPSDND